MHPKLSLNRDLLAIYLVAVFGLLLLPISVPNYSFVGFKADKLVHIALFAGLAALLRWNVSDKKHASAISLIFAFVVIVSTEAAQSFINYRSAEWADVIAGSVGALFGVIAMKRIMSSTSPEKLIGVMVSILGAMIITLCLFADFIRPHAQNRFGLFQIVGTVLGVLLVAGGTAVYLKRFQKSPSSH